MLDLWMPALAELEQTPRGFGAGIAVRLISHREFTNNEVQTIGTFVSSHRVNKLSDISSINVVATLKNPSGAID